MMTTGMRIRQGAMALSANVLLFLMAYVPLILMFAALVFPKSKVLSIALAISGLGIAVIGRYSVLHATQRSMTTVKVVSVTNNGGASMAYLATYILPFVTGVPESAAHWTAACIYLLTLFVIFCQTDVRSVNPTLFIFGMKVAAIRIDDGEPAFDAICLSPISKGDYISQTTFGGAQVVKKNPLKAQ